MKVLIVGDVVGKPGMLRLKEDLKRIIDEENIDFCIVNGENSANGKGIRLNEYNDILSYGADAITMGNHIYYRKEMAQMYKKLDRLVIPANVTNLDGNGNIIVEKNNIKYGVINLIGTFGMGEMFEKNTVDSFMKVSDEINSLKEKGADYIFVDYHAEATAEKIAMGLYLSDKVSCVFGTHTHVQTSDEKIVDGKMAYIAIKPDDNEWNSLGKDCEHTKIILGDYRKKMLSGNKNLKAVAVFYPSSENNVYKMSILTKEDYAKQIIDDIKKTVPDLTAGGHENRSGGSIVTENTDKYFEWVNHFTSSAEKIL